MNQRLIYVLAAGVVAWLALDFLGGPGPGPRRYDAFLGTWEGVEEDDVRVKLWMVASTQSGGSLGEVTVFDGRMEVDGLLPEPNVTGAFNFGYDEPLILNLVWDQADGVPVGGSMRVRIDGPDRLTVRTAMDPAAPLAPGFLESPEAVQLKRTAPPEGVVPPG